MFINKYRPHKLSEVIGQTKTVERLKNLIASGSLSNSLIFLGPTGLGKTSMARIIARLINCENKNACGHCDNCKALDGQNHPDYEELNGAKHSGIDDVRSILSQARFKPIMGLKRFIVIDEAQRLSPAALQCLLKDAEEPAEDTVFIICSMEPDKIEKSLHTRMTKFWFDFPPNIELRKLVTRINESVNSPALKNVLEDEAKLSDCVDKSQGSIREFVQVLESLVHGGEYHDVPVDVDQDRLVKINIIKYCKSQSDEQYIVELAQTLADVKNYWLFYTSSMKTINFLINYNPNVFSSKFADKFYEGIGRPAGLLKLAQLNKKLVEYSPLVLTATSAHIQNYCFAAFS